MLVIRSHQHGRYGVDEVEYNYLLRSPLCPDPPYPIDILRIPLHDSEQRIPEMLAVQRFGIDRPVRIRPPADTVSIMFAAGTDGNLTLGRMQKQLDITDTLKTAHTEKIERDTVVGDCYRRPFIAHLSELVSHHLIAGKIKRAE